MSARRPTRAQRGAAALVVVVLLFLLLALAAAYANRNLIFEQRSAVNQVRALQAFEAAEAGLEWALAQLNAGRIDDACVETGSAAGLSFRQRYLVVDAGSGVLSPVRLPAGGEAPTPTCVADGDGWRCHCPTDGPPSLAAPPGDGFAPAFRVRLAATGTAHAGALRIDVHGCTRLAEDCLRFGAGGDGEGHAALSALVAMQPALATMPSAAVTVLGSVEGGGALAATNMDMRRGGVTIQAGGRVDLAGKRLRSLPGTPGPASVAVNDATLAALAAAPDRAFASVTGVWPTSFRLQPAAQRFDCPTAGCRAALSDLAAAHPGRVLWANGDLVLDGDGDVGSAAAPVALFVAGRIEVTGAARIHGYVHTRGGWRGGGSVLGALFSEASLAADATPAVVHDAARLQAVARTHGSFVRLPGGWRDLP